MPYRSFQHTINDWELDSVINRFNRAEVKGVIIDIRDNEGGNPANGLLLMERLADDRTHIYTSQKKAGPERNDFLDSQEIFINPNDKHPHFPGKVIVLSNRKVYSAGSYFSAATKSLPEVILMGDTTGGGSGVPAPGLSYPTDGPAITLQPLEHWRMVSISEEEYLRMCMSKWTPLIY